MTDDKKYPSKYPLANASSDEIDSELDEEDYDEKSTLLSSREASPTPSEDEDTELDPRFNRPAPSRLKRFGLIIFAAVLFWIAIQMRSSVLESKKKPKIIHASRYSKEHRFRPAASPIITETLKDGRIKLRGALPAPTAPPKPIVKKRKPSAGKLGKKARKSKRKGSSSEKRM